MCISFIQPAVIGACRASRVGQHQVLQRPRRSCEDYCPSEALGRIYKHHHKTINIKDVRIVTQEQNLTIVVNPDPKEYNEMWIGGEGNGVAVMTGSPQSGK